MAPPPAEPASSTLRLEDDSDMTPPPKEHSPKVFSPDKRHHFIGLGHDEE
jgi:hypothetical protein